MPHAILRALRHRSTPTLLPSTSNLQGPELQDGFLVVPSIFITVPDEEGSHHWCAFAGTAVPLNASSSPSFDVPLPDFAAIEETIDRLKRAGETPTFRRPGKTDDVVLPKKKHGHQNHQHAVHSHSNNAGTGVGTKRPRPKRPQTSPITRQERAQVESKTASHEHAAPNSTTTEPNANGRFIPTKVLRSLSKGKKQKHRPPPVFTSIPYDSVVAQPFSAPMRYGASPRSPTSPKRQKRNSLGWLFSGKRANVPAMRESVEILDAVAEREHDAAQEAWATQINEYTVEYVMPACFEGDNFHEPPHSPAETHESDFDKPLPPIPVILANTLPQEDLIAEFSNDATSSETSVAEMQINDSVQVQVVMAINDAFRDVDFPLTQPRTPPAEETTSNIPSNASTMPSTTVEKEKKVKRKFSLKRLRERFLSGPTPAVAEDIPQVPDLPSTILVLPSIGPIDPPFTPPSLPVDPPFTPPSLPIDPPFTPPPIPVFVLSPPPPAVPVSRSEEYIVNAKIIETTRADSPSPPPLDEDSNVSTSSEGSSMAVSHAPFSPRSTPPDTPDSVHVGPVFGILQENDVQELKPDEKDPLVSEVNVEIAIVDTGITRSAGMRRQLDSLRFNETHIGAIMV
jgi:hypothetical protein